MSVLPRPVAGPRWALLTASPAPLVLLGWWRGGPVGQAPLDALAPALVATTALALAGLWLPRWPMVARALGGLGLVGLLALAAPALLASPALALLVSLVMIVVLLLFWRAVTRPAAGRAEGRLFRGLLLGEGARAACSAAAALWVMSALAGAPLAGDALGLAALGVATGIACLLLVQWAWVRRREERVRTILVALALGSVVAAGLLGAAGPVGWVDAAASLAVAGVAILPNERATPDAWVELFLGHPARLLVGTFAILCTLGTVLLALPRAGAGGVALPLGDAAFTAVSAVCVTGLSTIDVGTALSPFGQVVLLLLIQAGGLGIMTFSTAAMRVFGRRLSLRHEGAMARLVSSEDRSRVFASTFTLVRFTFAVELLGAAALWIAFVRAGHEPGRAVWDALFTSISAFCNAGFALAPDNLVAFAGEPAVLHVVGLLIIVGGLSPAVVLAVPRLVRGRPVPLQARLAFVTTLALLGVGFVAFLVLEWGHSLEGLDPLDRIHNAWFQSVTLRTAGFNSVDLSAVGPVTLLVMMLLMLAGGSPGGTAGGVKTTTIAVIVLAVLASVRGQTTVLAGRRRVSLRTLFTATAVLAVFAVVLLGALMTLLLTQDTAPRVAAFEAVSALGTVGLTIGGTMAFDEIGRGVLMALMFIGRVGPLTLLVFLSRERARPDRWQTPDNDVEVA